MKFLSAKTALIILAEKMFNIQPKELDDDFSIAKIFHEILPEVYGKLSYPPKDYMSKYQLDFAKNEIGRSYFSTFLSLAMQCGSQVQYDSMIRVIKELEESNEHNRTIREMYLRENTKLKLNQLPSNELSKEIVILREKINQLEKENNDLKVYKDSIEAIVRRFK